MDTNPAANPRASAVLLHPHPDMGGNRHNNVISALYEALPAAGVTAYRFDFESSDLTTARHQTIESISGMTAPVVLVGYSFGGGIAATVEHPSLLGWYLIAPALSMVESLIGADPRPKHVVSAEHDTFFTPAALTAATADWAATTHSTVTGADHFFGGIAHQVAAACAAWVELPA